MEEISETLRRVEKRLSALEGAVPAPDSISPVPDAQDELPATPALPAQGDVLNVLTQVGRSCLVLGGAFLVRALTDSGTLPRPLGAALGLAYAVLWILFAERAAARGRTISGGFLGITAVVIAYPLIVETSTRMAIFSPAGAALILGVLTALCVAVAYLRGLAVLAWAALAAAVGSAFVLALVTRAVEPFAAAFLAIGLASAWLAYTPRPWYGLRWPAAIAADLLLLWAALRLAPSEPPAAGAAPSSSFFLLLAFALPFLYLGTSAVSTLVRRRAVTAFDVVQSIGSLAVGFGGAALVVRYVKDAHPTLGASALLIAAGCYGVAFVFVEKRQGHGRNFFFYATLALVLTVWGSVLVGAEAFRGYFWCVLALVSAVLATRFARTTLAAHSAVYALAAAWQTGLAAASLDAFVAPAARPWTPWTAAAFAAVAASAAAYVLFAREKSRAGRARDRIARVVLAVIIAFGGGGFVVAVLRFISSPWGAAPDPGEVAVIRTAVLAAAALLLAAASRRADLPELAWLAYAVLILGAGKLLIEDLPGGRPVTLFLAFAFYGTALILAPRLLRRAPPLPPREAGPSLHP